MLLRERGHVHVHLFTIGDEGITGRIEFKVQCNAVVISGVAVTFSRVCMQIADVSIVQYWLFGLILADGSTSVVVAIAVGRCLDQHFTYNVGVLASPTALSDSETARCHRR